MNILNSINVLLVFIMGVSVVSVLAPGIFSQNVFSIAGVIGIGVYFQSISALLGLR